MLISLQKISQLFLLLLFIPLICSAEDDGAPAKFYDGLPIEAEKTVKPHTAKPKQGLSNPFLQLFTTKKAETAKQVETAKDDDSDAEEQELERAAAAQRKKISRPNNNPPAPPDLKLNSASKDDTFQTYVVGKNETLYSIALRFKVPFAQLAAWNAITSTNQLYSGQKLKIFKHKQKHSTSKSPKNQLEPAENLRENSQKTSIISINNKSMLKFYCHWPTKGKIIKTFSQSGGRGIEISGKAGQAIKAIAEGNVVAVSPGIYGHGGFIVIEHADRILSSYANNSRSLVKNGQAVAQGQMIAEMGRVGRKPPSLELEIRKNGVLVNPMLCLPKKT